MHLISVLLLGCSDYKLRGEEDNNGNGRDSGYDWDDTGDADDVCEGGDFAATEVGLSDHCYAGDGSFTPIVEWDYGDATGCTAQPAVGDLDGDGMPEIVINISPLSFPGTLTALHGDGSGVLWTVNAEVAYGSGATLADVDDDGSPEVFYAKEYTQSLFTEGDYTVVALDSAGKQVWESEHFIGLDFDWATAISVSDMDHDGVPELVAGRVILNAVTGDTLGVGEHGRGSYGISGFGDFSISEGSVSAIADLDLDGVEEVVTGNAIYAIDGSTLWADPSEDDGMIAIANLDSDPEGEFIAISYNTYRAHDTDGSILWGPTAINKGNILSVPAVADLDLDGFPEFVVAGGNELRVVNHDGSILWTAKAQDESGATGASIFDFEGDGQPDVVYIDEIEMIAFDGATGAVKFYSTEHASGTMFDYPAIADVDADDQAEIVVCHSGYASALSVYGDQDESWPPARQVWNQHAYSISNINDDLSVPTTAVPGFTDTNTWHSAIASDGYGLVADLEGSILDVCEDDCDAGTVRVVVRMDNKGAEAIGAGVNLALYGDIGAYRYLLAQHTTTADVDSGWSTEGIEFELIADQLAQVEMLYLEVDDDGTGTGAIAECSEKNNTFEWAGPFCQ